MAVTSFQQRGSLLYITATAHGLSLGDTARIVAERPPISDHYPNPGRAYVTREVKEVVDANEFAVAPINLNNYTHDVAESVDFPPLTVQLAPFVRQVKSKSVPAVVAHDFFVTRDPLGEVEVVQAFQATKDNGGDAEDTDILDASTSPSAQEWKSMVLNRVLVPAEASTVENYGGDIWLRKTPFVLPE